jgi:hypothetical protein
VVAQAGLHGGERCRCAGGAGGAAGVRSFEHLRWLLTQAALESRMRASPGSGPRRRGANDGLALVHTAEHRA